jgi:hypothetical protein
MVDGMLRRRSPVVVVGYGDPGLDWLAALRQRCNDSRALQPLIDTETLQFWCFGTAAQPRVGIQSYEAWPDAAMLSDALDRARGTGNVAAIPGLTVQEVLLLERLSLFQDSSATNRATLQSLVSAIPGVQWGSSDDTVGFRIRWIALADSLHDVARVTSKAKASALKSATDDSCVSTTYLVDRENSATAVLNGSSANAALLELAFAYLNGDLGAPRADGHAVALPQVLQAKNGQAIPFSVTILRHRWKEIEAHRVDQFLSQLARGIPDHQVRATLSLRPPINQVLEADTHYLSENRYEPYRRNRIRDEAIEETMVLALAEADVRRLKDHLVAFRRRLVELRSNQRLPPLLGGMASIALIARQGDSVVSGTALDWKVAAGIAVVAIIAFMVWKQSRRVNRLETGANSSVSTVNDDSWQEVRGAWDAACARLEQFFDYWERVVEDAEASRDRPDSQRPVWQPLAPFGRVLNVGRLQSAVDITVTPSTCKQVAKSVHAGMLKRMPPEDAVRLACEQELRRMLRSGAESIIIADQLKLALGERHTTELAQLLETCPYLVKSSRPIERNAVLWFAHHSLGIEKELRDLEDLKNRDSTSVFTHDDVDQCVRIAIGAPISWGSVVSLN